MNRTASALVIFLAALGLIKPQSNEVSDFVFDRFAVDVEVWDNCARSPAATQFEGAVSVYVLDLCPVQRFRGNAG